MKWVNIYVYFFTLVLVFLQSEFGMVRYKGTFTFYFLSISLSCRCTIIVLILRFGRLAILSNDIRVLPMSLVLTSETTDIGMVRKLKLFGPQILKELTCIVLINHVNHQ